MIIYLEGPDGSGKSTLIEFLADALINVPEYKVKVNANTRIPTHPKAKDRVTEKTLFAELKAMAKDDNIHIIDRGPISDVIYRVFDKHESVTTIDKIVNFFVYNKRALIIYCHNKDAEKNMLERGDNNPVAIKRHKEISKIYDLVFAQFKQQRPYNLIDYDYTKKNAVNKVIGDAIYFAYMMYKN